ncbi:hypothetical protein [Spiroplasma turonicum]|uniref:Uncharacterized protein n=1 Tax=Spiroplasma turonicum TaxID=216946 RepID=A0A0K1P6T0_9MOLU|nr:hypothetical protein [Spiroplasma turonicum]AKU79929.1 hypothetical protein STURON_00683 [Spiroplasma turonicum]ALX70943.1 hypothetical protein STURO_v1c06840 [Spiroplasma turonicum]
MKAKLKLLLLLLPIIIVFIINIALFISSFKKIDYTLEGRLETIIRKNDIWPDTSYDYLNIWEDLQEKTLDELNNSSSRITNYYSSNYVRLFSIYKDNKYSGNKDEFGVPNYELDNLLQDIYNSDEVQFQSAYLLKSLFIEAQINYIKGNFNNLINPTSEIVLWSFKYFNALVFFNWLKIWVQDLGRTVEKPLSIDFYTFGSYIRGDELGRERWDLPPIFNNNEPIPVTRINGVLKEFIDNLYNFVFIKNRS